MFAPLEFPRITPGQKQEEVRDAASEPSGEKFALTHCYAGLDQP